MLTFITIIAVAGAALTIFSPAPFWQLAGAIGWLCLIPTWATAMERRRDRVRLHRIYRAATALTQCVNEHPDFICRDPGPKHCGACWVMVMGQDPAAFEGEQEGC